MLGMKVEIPSDSACEDRVVPGVDMHGVNTSALSVSLSVDVLVALLPCCTLTGTILGVKSALGGGADMLGANKEPAA